MQNNNINNINNNKQINLQAYEDWQQDILNLIKKLNNWLIQHDLQQKHLQILIEQTIHHTKNRKLNVAFIAEFSRGKSELINALFFANYQARILPTSSGRTTMCPTELMNDPHKLPYLKLLPIQSYEHASGTEEFLDREDLWQTVSISSNSEEIAEALKQLQQTIFVSQEQAEIYGLFDPENPEHQYFINADGLVEISKWRHAVINLPHPLLKQGLVVLDTPGLNAIGSEPELALRLIPEADIIVFILAADMGVSKTDLGLWLNHIKAHQHQNAIVVLNKIDTLWDPLKSLHEYRQEISKQMLETAQHLNIDGNQIYPISAKQGLIAKIQNDSALYQKSGLAYLEETFQRGIIPKRKSLLLAKIENQFQQVIDYIRQNLQQQKLQINAQIDELKIIHHKIINNNQNDNGLTHYLQRLNIEQEEFDIAILHLQTMRQSFNQIAGQLLELTQTNPLENLRQFLQIHLNQNNFNDEFTENILENAKNIKNSENTEESNKIEIAGKTFASNDFQTINTPSAATEKFSELAQWAFDQSIQKMQELDQLLETMIDHLNLELAIDIKRPEAFNFIAYEQAYKEIQKNYQRQTHDFDFSRVQKQQIQQRFFETMASRLKQWMYNLHQDLDLWLKKTTSALDAQIKQQEKHLQERQSLFTTKNVENSGGLENSENNINNNLNITYKIELLQNDINMLELRMIELQNIQTEFGFLSDECQQSEQNQQINQTNNQQMEQQMNQQINMISI